LYLTKYTITQVEPDLFKIGDNRSEVICSSELLPLMFDLMTDFAMHEEKGVFHLKNKELELYGSLAMLYCLQELRRGDYECDYKGKVVLDVGGFEGESAAYFWLKGAKQVVIYEPLAQHTELIRKNVMLNHIQAEIHQQGIGDEDGVQIIEYTKMDPGFGVLCKGPNRIEIKVKNISKVIDESGAEIGKFDCEGAEECLLGVPVKILQKIAYYIIEIHSHEMRGAILEKFQCAGFTLEREKTKSWQYSILSVKRAF
jgi:FkbM family methyltransferase